MSSGMWFPTMWPPDTGRPRRTRTAPTPPRHRNPKRCPISCPTVTEHSIDKQRLWPDCTYAQADLRPCWSHIPHSRKSRALAQITFIIKSKKQITAKRSKANQKQRAKNKTRHNTEGSHIQGHPISGAVLGTAGKILPPASCKLDCSRSGEPRTWMTSDHFLVFTLGMSAFLSPLKL